MQNENFCAFILSHGRADKVYTYNTLRKSGYSGKIIVIVDNEDKTLNDYKKKFKNEIYVFDKPKIAQEIDEGDNFRDRRAIIYARNACFKIAKVLGFQYFVQLDDDYTTFNHKKDNEGNYTEKKIVNLDKVLALMLEYYKKIPALSIAMAQGGDFIGGKQNNNLDTPRRKCMNSMICSTDRPYQFFGRINEDVNTYTNLGSRGGLFLTIMQLELKQKQTQKNKGGMTEMYLDSGTYVKSFYSVMYQPSSVKIGILSSKNSRIHHTINWKYTVPRILTEQYKKTKVINISP